MFTGVVQHIHFRALLSSQWDQPVLHLMQVVHAFLYIFRADTVVPETEEMSPVFLRKARPIPETQDTEHEGQDWNLVCIQTADTPSNSTQDVSQTVLVCVVFGNRLNFDSFSATILTVIPYIGFPTAGCVSFPSYVPTRII